MHIDLGAAHRDLPSRCHLPRCCMLPRVQVSTFAIHSGSQGVFVQEGELANLQRSLRALSGPAQPGRAAQAPPGRFCGTDAPGTVDTGVFCEDNAASGPQGTRIAFPKPAKRTAAPSWCSKPKPQPSAIPAPQQSFRPASSLLDTSHAQQPEGRTRQLRRPQSSPAQPPPSNLASNTQQAKVGVSSGAAPLNRNAGRALYGPDQAAAKDYLHDNPSARHAEQGQAGVQDASRHSRQQTTAPPHAPIPQQPGQWDDHRTPKRPSTTRTTQDPHRSGAAGRQEGRAGARQQGSTSASGLSERNQTLSTQPAETGHPAISPSLEPAPYTVQEPDSPAHQEHAKRAQNITQAPHMQMPAACIFTETTITRLAPL